MAKSSSKLMQFAKGTLVLTISNLMIKAANFFLLPLYTKYLTPEQLGTLDSITSLMSVVFPILVLAFDSAFSVFFYEQDDEEHKKKVFNTTFFFLLGMSLFTIIPMLFSNQISLLLFGSTEYSASIAIAMISVAVNMWFLPFSLLIRMQNRMTVFSVISFTASLSMLLLNIYFVTVLQWGYFSLIASNILVHVLQLVLFSLCSKATLNIKLINKQLLKNMLKYSLPMMPLVLSNWALTLSDRYILLFYSGEYEVGIYGVSARFLSVLTVITSAIYTAFASFAFSSNKDKNAKEQYVLVLDLVNIVLLGITLFASVFSTEILHIMVDKSYYSADVLIGPLLFGQVCYAANTIMGYGFAYKKKSAYYLIPSMAGAGLNILLNFLFIPKYGALAASITTFIGYFVMMLLTYILSKKVYQCEYHFVKLVITVLTSFALAMFATYIQTGLVFKVAAFVVACVGIIILYKGTFVTVFNKLKKKTVDP